MTMRKTADFMLGVPMTAVGGVFLAASLALMLVGRPVAVDPAWATVLISGVPLMYYAIWRMIHNQGVSKITSALLISMAMVAAAAIGDVFAAGEVAFIMAIGGILEEKTVSRARKGLKSLLSLAPQQGRRILADGREQMLDAQAIHKGDLLKVLPGEAIPVDGEIVTGSTSVDQSVITGESLPVDKAPGDKVYCGTINRFGAITLRATEVGEDSSLNKLIRLVQEAEANKAPMQRIVDRWASWLVPAALLVAVLTYFGTRDMVRAVTILVVFCPCALVLATPTAIMAAIGQAAKHGVIIKSGEALERMGKANCIAFDKTGTLTRGNLAVSDVLPLAPGVTQRQLLGLAASVEALSEHPLARAIVQRAGEEGISITPAEDFAMVPGRGVGARVAGQQVLCGNGKWLEDHGITLTAQTHEALDRLRQQGKATLLVARDGLCLGAVALSDTLRDTAGDIIARLHKDKAHSVLLTGDHRHAARHLAGQLGITALHAELLPEEKVQVVRQLHQAGNTVCMIGDGVNDAPALKVADVGVAMGSMGSDIAVEAADIALMGDDLGKIPYLKRLSRATVNTIKFSITLSMAINFAAIILGVMGLLNPTTGALVHNAGSVLVVLIAALLYDRKFQ